MFGIELFVPFLIFAPRRPRQFACLAVVFLQVLIFLTGNYCFFNLLAMALCVLLLDDAALKALVPSRLRNLLARKKAERTGAVECVPTRRRGITIRFARSCIPCPIARTPTRGCPARQAAPLAGPNHRAARVHRDRHFADAILRLCSASASPGRGRCWRFTLAGAVPHLQQLRPVRGDDHDAAGDHHRRQQRRRRLAGLRVQIQARRREAASRVR